MLLPAARLHLSQLNPVAHPKRANPFGPVNNMIGPGGERAGRQAGSLAQLRQAVDGAERTVRELAVSRSFLDHVLDSVRDAVLVSTPDGQIQRANDAACRLLGLSADALNKLGI